MMYSDLGSKRRNHGTQKKRITTKLGYVKYLRTSDEDAQAPERSQNRQRHNIDGLIRIYTDLPD